MPVNDLRTSHGVHIHQHLEHLRSYHEDGEVLQLLQEIGLVDTPTQVLASDQSDVSTDLCAKYLESVKQHFGSIAGQMARMNFALAGCEGLRRAR